MWDFPIHNSDKRINDASVRVTGNCSTNDTVSFNLVLKFFRRIQKKIPPVDTRLACCEQNG